MLRPALRTPAKAPAALRRASFFRRSISSSARGKDARREAETRLGRSLLEAAGASEDEIVLRARSVGWELLRRREAAEKEARAREKRRGKLGQKDGSAARYDGGSVLVSKFSLG